MTCETCKGYSDRYCPCCQPPDDGAEKAMEELENWYLSQSSTDNEKVNEQINWISQWHDNEDTIREVLIRWANTTIAGYLEGKAFAVDKIHWCILKDWEIVAVKSTDELIKWFLEVDGDFDNWLWMDDNEIYLQNFTTAKRLPNTELIDYAWSCDG